MSIQIRRGDCREVLLTLPDKSVHCVVTSPPYWGLRDYGVGGQIGLESSPDAYVATMVEVFREVRRVLRDDGTVWLNLGDSYAGYHGNRNSEIPTSAVNGWTNGTNENLRTTSANRNGLKPKDLVGIPWRVAFALQADGWWLRQDIIWAKPNPMPESVTDRCTKAHEYIFLLSKSERYYYDADAIKEAGSENSHPTGKDGYRGPVDNGKILNGDRRDLGKTIGGGGTTRNKRSVWEVATQPFAEAHFATFPPALIEPCILAGCPKQCCAKCGSPWVRQTEISRRDTRPNLKSKFGGLETDLRATGPSNVAFGLARRTEATVTTLGFSPSCSCNADTVPGVCLDPFGGAGTTGLVADRWGRDAVLIELNPDYAAMADLRITDDAPLFANVDSF